MFIPIETHGFGSPLSLAYFLIGIIFGFGSALALDMLCLWLSFGLSLTLNLSKLSFFKCCSILCSLAIIDKKNWPNELSVDLFGGLPIKSKIERKQHLLSDQFDFNVYSLISMCKV